MSDNKNSLCFRESLQRKENELMQETFLDNFFCIKDGKISVTVWGILMIVLIAAALIFLFCRLVKYVGFRKKENDFFHKYLRELERDESLDRSIDIIQKNLGERCFVRIYENGENVSKKYILEVKDVLFGGSDFSKCKIYINDEQVKPVQFRLSFEGSRLILTVCSNDSLTRLVRTDFFGVKKVFNIKNNEKIALKSGDVLLVGMTSLSISVFSNQNGII